MTTTECGTDGERTAIRPRRGAQRPVSPTPSRLVIPAKAGTYWRAPRLRASGTYPRGLVVPAKAGTYPIAPRRNSERPPAKREAAPRGAAPHCGAAPDGYAAASSSLSPLSPVAPDSAESLSAPQLLPNHPPCPRPPLNP